MYGVISKGCSSNADYDQRAQKLQELHVKNRETFDLKEKVEQLVIAQECIKNDIEALRKDILGSPNDGEDETSGFVHNFRARLDEQRDEYFGLIERYMNELDKKRLEDIESRLAKLEERPKFNVLSASSKIPPVDIAKKDLKK